ncbi:YceI family protein [Streptomyces sp. ISL-36]|uniref:YceI family protein n=1 Tax=Streptomyces sp. ISL-36 TaxID=2819182 RepID=UPI001BE8EB4C|nr:YceI family protein [Streptomyces sp. ISL-36]MBT2442911.1 YceI family protein [Streptomyces sp. ISL-36]
MSTTTKPDELTGDYVIDTTHTRVGFVARHTMATRVRGQFEDFEGGARLDGGDPSKSGARLTIQAKSVQTHNPQRDDLLCGKFLDADNHPAITFTSTNVKQVDETHFKVTDDLAVRGVTQPVTFDVELIGAASDPQGDFRVRFKGSATIKREDWGVNWNPVTTALVSSKVMLEFDVTVVRRL